MPCDRTSQAKYVQFIAAVRLLARGAVYFLSKIHCYYSGIHCYYSGIHCYYSGIRMLLLRATWSVPESPHGIWNGCFPLLSGTMHLAETTLHHGNQPLTQCQHPLRRHFVQRSLKYQKRQPVHA